MANTLPTRPAVVDALTTVQPSSIWPAIVRRLNADVELAGVLGGPNRVSEARARLPYVGNPDDVWGRVVVVPVVRLAPVSEDAPNTPRVLPFLVRVDVSDPDRDDYDPRWKLDVAHARVFRLLYGWATRVPGARIVRPIWREFAPQPEPLLSDDGLLYSSAEYRLEAVPAPLT